MNNHQIVSITQQGLIIFLLVLIYFELHDIHKTIDDGFVITQETVQ